MHDGDTEPIDLEEIARLLRMDGYDSNPCHPGNGGIGGLRPWCHTCGVATAPWMPCARSDCGHRAIG